MNREIPAVAQDLRHLARTRAGGRPFPVVVALILRFITGHRLAPGSLSCRRASAPHGHAAPEPRQVLGNKYPRTYCSTGVIRLPSLDDPGRSSVEVGPRPFDALERHRKGRLQFLREQRDRELLQQPAEVLERRLAACRPRGCGPRAPGSAATIPPPPAHASHREPGPPAYLASRRSSALR